MTTIKSYTGIKQSKKLVEILPLESADMFCADVLNKEKETHSYNFHILSTWGCNTFEELKNRENKFVCFIPVWSLTALLEELNRNYWKVSLKCCGAEWDMTYDDGERYISVSSDYAIDACYEMILKLHERKML